MKTNVFRYGGLLLVCCLWIHCHFKSSCSKRVIPMRELSNQSIDTSQLDTLWEVPAPSDAIRFQ